MEEILKTLGLTEQERKIYTSCLKLGSAKASEIALKAGIERKASYYTLELLISKGMLTESIKSGVKYYSTTDLRLLLQRIEEEKKTKEQAVKDLIEQSKELGNSSISKPIVQQYEGLEGYKTILRELTSKSNSKIYGYVSEKIATFMPIFAMQFRRARRENKVYLNAIVEKSPSLQESKKDNKQEMREFRFSDIVKNKDYGLYISEDKVIFVKVTPKEQIGIKIEDKSFAELQKTLFDTLWKMSKK